MDPEEAAKRAEKGAYLTRAIPGAKYNVEKAARPAKIIYKVLEAKEHKTPPSL